MHDRMHVRRNALVAATAALAVVSASVSFVGRSSAEPSGGPAAWSPPAHDAEAVALAKLGGVRRATVPVAGAKYAAGRADALVDAPVSAVKAVVLGYDRYASLIPQFKRAKVLQRRGLGADVYLLLPVLHGAASIWTVQRFAPPVVKGKVESIASTSVKGNVDALRTTWSYRAVDATHTIVTAHIYVEPQIPAPGATIANEAEKVAAQAVTSIKARAESAVAKTASTP